MARNTRKLPLLVASFGLCFLFSRVFLHNGYEYHVRSDMNNTYEDYVYTNEEVTSMTNTDNENRSLHIPANSVTDVSNVTGTESVKSTVPHSVRGRKPKLSNPKWAYGDYLVNATLSSYYRGERLEEEQVDLLNTSFIRFVSDHIGDTTQTVSSTILYGIL